MNCAAWRGRTAGSTAAARARGGRLSAHVPLLTGSHLMGSRRAPKAAALGPTSAALTVVVVSQGMVAGPEDDVAAGCAREPRELHAVQQSAIALL